VILIDDVSKYPEPGLADVVCVISPVAGDFENLISIQSNRLLLPCETVIAFVQQLSRGLDSRLLVPDEDVDPYSMLLISGDHPPVRIGLEPSELDEGRYIVAQP
jgi:hypothetical protein